MSSNVSSGEQLEILTKLAERHGVSLDFFKNHIEHYKHYSPTALISEIKHFDAEVRRASLKLAVMQAVLSEKAKGVIK